MVDKSEDGNEDDDGEGKKSAQKLIPVWSR